MTLTFKSYPRILEDLVAFTLSNTPITDMNPGSVALTLLEAIARNDYEQYMSMVDIVRTFNLDTTTGLDLDERALEYGVTRLLPTASTGRVTFTDTAFDKVSTKVYSGMPGPISGQSYLYVSSALNFTPTGSIVIGRDTNNVETISYNTITPVGGGVYYRIDLDSGLTNAHGTEESVILSQGGTRTIPSGTQLYVQSSDVNPQINFITLETATIQDGETEVTDVLVRCNITGSVGNVAVGSLRNITSLPFTTCTVTNPETFTNGSDLESDVDLRDRVKTNIQSLSRATKATLLAKVVGMSSYEQQARVTSASFIEATELDQPSYLYIDDGTGFEPTFEGVGYEVLVAEATGGERYLQLDNQPLVKASLVSLGEEPFLLSSGSALTFDVNGVIETIILRSTSFINIAAATAEEIAAEINNLSSIVEARTTGGRKQVIIQAVDTYNERLQVKTPASPLVNANDILAFTEDKVMETLNLYKNDILLNKDGLAAEVVSVNAEPYALAIPGSRLQMIVDGKSTIQEAQWSTAGLKTAQDIVDQINADISGVLASVTPANTVSIRSTNPDTSVSSIKIENIGSADDANLVLGFSTDISVGESTAYVLNRYNGQIRLDTVLSPYDKVTAGSLYTRGWDRSSIAEPYAITAGEAISVSINGGGAQTYTFGTTGGYTAQQIADLINGAKGGGTVNSATFIGVGVDDLTSNGSYIGPADTTYHVRIYSTGATDTFEFSNDGGATWDDNGGLGYNCDTALTLLEHGVYIQFAATTGHAGTEEWSFDVVLNGRINGATFFSYTLGTDAYLAVTVNDFDGDTGTIQVLSSPASIVFGGALEENQDPNFAYVGTENTANYTLGPDQNLIVVLDDDSVDRVFDMTMHVAGTVSTSDTTTFFKATGLSTEYQSNNFFTNCKIQFDDNTSTIALRSQVSYVVTWDAPSGGITVAPAFPAIPGVSDTFKIIPVTAVNVCDFLNEPKFTNLQSFADITVIDGGTKVQIAATEPGTAKTVQVTGGTANSISIAFATDGTASGTTTADSIGGLSVGLPASITDDTGATYSGYVADITGSGPYTITFDDTWPATSTPDISTFSILNNSRIIDTNGLGFSTSKSEGVDGYKYYTGLVQEVHNQLMGLDTDLSTYPGWAAAGVQIEVTSPVIDLVKFEIDVTPEDTIVLGTLTNLVKSQVVLYVNSLKVGEDIVLSEIVHRIQRIRGVYDVEILNPTANVAIADNEIARTSDSLVEVA